MRIQDDRVFFRKLQQQELNGAALYERIAQFTRDDEERETLLAISSDERKHAELFAKYSGCVALQPNHFRVTLYSIAARLLGYTFVIKLLEHGENLGTEAYRAVIDRVPELDSILNDEEIHEKKLLDILNEERLRYVGDMVLGMNDALVELTGALAGYTLAMQNTHVIAMAGLITGVSATLSMAASVYLSSREAGQKNAVKSSAYTGFAYLLTVALLIIPYLLFPPNSYFWPLGIMLLIAIIIIACFNFYISIAKSRPFFHNFCVMAGISMGVAAISFMVGLMVKNVLGIDL